MTWAWSLQSGREDYRYGAGPNLPVCQVFMFGIAITQISRYETYLKTLCTLTTTIRAAFKIRVHYEIPTHYVLNYPSDSNTEVTHRQQCMPLLVENHTYLFVVSLFCIASKSSPNQSAYLQDEIYEQGSLSLVNHPGIFTIIITAVWETALYKELKLNDIDSLNNLFSLGSTTTHLVLMEHFRRKHQMVNFLALSTSSAEYRFIQQLNLDI